jgi:hypothetical protein
MGCVIVLAAWSDASGATVTGIVTFLL